MARTLVGRLQLIVQAMGLGEAKKVEGAIKGIERAAKSLSSAPWGQNFERQIHKMALSAKELDQVKRSWDNLQKDIAGRGLAAALRKSEISAWKTATIGNLAAVRAQMLSTERRALSLGKALKGAIRPAYIMAGGYTGAYLAGNLGREALTAASESRRVMAEAKYAGLSEAEQRSIKERAQKLAADYRMSFSSVFDMLKETVLSMPSLDAAMKASDANARAMLVFNNSLGEGAGVAGVRNFAKSMDLLERLDPAQYTRMLDGFLKMQQILGRDIDPDAYFQAVKYSRAGGKVGSDDFMSIYLPMLIAETGGANAGNSIRAGFDQFVVGKASKKALAAQRRYGLRDDNDILVNEKDFGENPIKWIYDTLLPALNKQGFNKDNKVELARVIGELSSNRLASDQLIGAILNQEQVFRYLEKRVPNAAGLKAADDIQNDNSFAAWRGFKDALENLSTSIMPMEQIGAGLNRFADTINAFNKKVREGDPRVLGGAGILGAGIAAYGGWKVAMGIWGLITAGASLQTAATMLQAAAIAQGGGVGGAAGATAKSGGSWLSLLGFGSLAGLAAGSLNLAQSSWLQTAEERARNARNAAGTTNYLEQRRNGDGRGWQRFLFGDAAEPGFSLGDHMRNSFDFGGAERGRNAFSEMLDGMDKLNTTTVSPPVDLSQLRAMKSLVDGILTGISSIGGAVTSAGHSLDAQMRRAHTDFGTVP